MLVLELIGEIDLRHSAAAAAVACGYRGPGEAGGRGGGRPGLLLLAADDGPLQGPLLTRPADESLIGPLETNTLDAVSPGADPAAETAVSIFNLSYACKLTRPMDPCLSFQRHRYIPGRSFPSSTSCDRCGTSCGCKPCCPECFLEMITY